MSNTIHVLPDHIANQIAAGEVIQRPASAVKELLENAVDAAATEIHLIVNDAGKALVQVIDNGKGMGAADARLCFERHATSKINQIEDLFRIRTMGFRGEALASIAAVAQVEIKTRTKDSDVGSQLEVANRRVESESPVAVPIGTSIAMKNLFFNVPARRNFLKSNAAEMRHILEEFTRVALAFPEIRFLLTANHQQLYHLEPGSLKQRVVQLLGNPYQSKLVAVQEQTDYLTIRGFVGKPETAKKTRGDQYFFVNNRFIKSAYLHHAVMSAYQELIAGDQFPSYVLFIDLDPRQVDVNVHPTKQEIKFEDEKIVYAFVQAAIRHALAQFSITPTLDFDLDAGIQSLSAIQQPFTEDKKQATAGSRLFSGFTQKNQAHLIDRSAADKPWAGLPIREVTPPEEQQTSLIGASLDLENTPLTQLLQTYIIFPIKDGYRLIHQQRAHERIRYEKLMQADAQKPMASQRSMFPATLELNAADASILEELLPPLRELGYQIEPFGKNTYVVHGTPADLESGEEQHTIDWLLEQYKQLAQELKLPQKESLIRALARQQAIRSGEYLTEREIRELVQELLHCQQGNVSPDGHPTYLEFRKEQLNKLFGY
ncbi:MAG: DNA mismatch repair endonuclease MutL [Bacteroidetes bacterium]|nr:DNA mismatch repair endonuclease MutL [Bacteroidota bacterium]